MESWADEQVKWLKRRYPDWDIWYVPQVGRAYIWCARPTGAPVAIFRAEAPDDLAVKIAKALAG